MRRRGVWWWLTYKNADGETIQENSRTTDQGEAQRLLAARALETLEAKTAVLKRVLSGKVTGAQPGPEADSAELDLVDFLLKIAARREKEEADEAAQARRPARGSQSGTGSQQPAGGGPLRGDAAKRGNGKAARGGKR